jgi:transposase
MFVEFAAMRAGISPRTVYRWMERGRREGIGRCYEFMSAVKKALAEYQLTLQQQIAAADQWQAKAWLLERRFPKQWGRKVYKQTVVKDKGADESGRSVTEIIERARGILAGRTVDGESIQSL